MRRQIIGAAAVIAAFTLLLPAGAGAQGTTTAEGFVLTPEGEPIPDVQVLLQYTGHMPQRYRARTDENGRFIQPRVWSGPYDITFSREGFPDVTLKDVVIRDIIHPDKPPVFRLHAKTAPPPPPEPEEETPKGPTAEEMAGDLAAELDAANEHLAAGRLDEALAAYENVAAAAADLPEVHHDIGLAAMKKGDLARAETEFRRAAELDPGLPEPHGALAVLLAQAGNRDEAIVEAEMAVELDPEDTRSLYHLALMYKDSGRPQDAEGAFLELEELDPDDVEIQFHLGTTLIAMGRMDEAIARLEKYVELAPADAPNVAPAQGMIDAVKKQQ